VVFQRRAAGTRPLERRLARSRIGRFTPISDFGWNWPRQIDRPAIEAALRLDFLTDARNIVLVAAQGLGKTMIAQSIAHASVLAGPHVLFTRAAQLLLDLGAQKSAGGLARRLNPRHRRRPEAGRAAGPNCPRFLVSDNTPGDFREFSRIERWRTAAAQARRLEALLDRLSAVIVAPGSG
jgi:hypothetical protein